MPPPDSSLSLRLKAAAFRLLAHLLRLRCSRLRFARVTRLGLRIWPTAPLRAFQSERQGIAAPACSLFTPLPRPVAKTCRLWLPLERLSSFAGPTVDRLPPNPTRLGSPVEAPLMNFQIRRSTPLFVLSAPPPFPLRGRPAQTLHFAYGFGNSQESRES